MKQIEEYIETLTDETVKTEDLKSKLLDFNVIIEGEKSRIKEEGESKVADYEALKSENEKAKEKIETLQNKLYDYLVNTPGAFKTGDKETVKKKILKFNI